MAKELAKAYEPREVEDRIYGFWMEGNYFHAEIDKDKKPYTIVMPPPNITGQLHMGHAMDNTLQDILIRFKRMQGYAALWLPGTDHASISTEMKVVEQLRGEAGAGNSLTLENGQGWNGSGLAYLTQGESGVQGSQLLGVEARVSSDERVLWPQRSTGLYRQASAITLGAGLADAIVDLVSTGNTLRANQLVAVEHIEDISSRLVVNLAALKLKHERIRPLLDAFAATVAA